MPGGDKSNYTDQPMRQAAHLEKGHRPRLRGTNYNGNDAFRVGAEGGSHAEATGTQIAPDR